ncbi:MAG TPA: hypothetical protein VMU54_10055 [Planctomycetota bacterium]|nr:hypothetical protein [Planctomycetota bacterium]
MTKHPTPLELEAYAYDSVDPPRQAPVHDHVAACPACRNTVDLEREERETLFRALAPDPLESPSILLRDRSARVLAAAAAAVLLISALWWAIPGGRTPVPGEPRTGDVEWRYPVEVSEVHNPRQGLRAVVRTPDGVIGVLFDRTLFFSKGGVRPWAQIQGIAGQTSAPLVEGEAVHYLAWEGGLLSLMTVRFGDSTTSASQLPWPDALRQVRVHALELAVRDNLKIALVEASDRNGPGKLYVSRSQDSGRTWDAFRDIALGTLKSGQHGLVSTADGEDVYYVTNSGTLACVRSVDRGATWAPAALMPPGTIHRVLDYIRAVSVGKTIHLVYSVPESGKGAALLHLSSDDGGRSWSEPVRISTLDRVGISFETRDQFQLRALGDALICSVASGMQGEKRGRLFVSRDGGKSWRDEEQAFAGLRAVPQAALSWGGSQGILLGLHLILPEGGEYLLLRETGASPAPSDPAPAAPWWKGAGR